MGLLSSGVAEVGVRAFTMTKERSEVVAFTDAIGSER
jgi:hypothetical protein